MEDTLFMEVAKNKFSKLRKKKVKCKSCRSRLRISYDDLKMVYSNVMLTGYYFECACCTEIVLYSLKEGEKLKKRMQKDNNRNFYAN